MNQARILPMRSVPIGQPSKTFDAARLFKAIHGHRKQHHGRRDPNCPACNDLANKVLGKIGTSVPLR